jgi:catechol 2,3-dioxygenase
MPTIARSTTVGAVHLTVSDLARSLRWYRDVVGLHARDRAGGVAALTADGDDLLVLYEEPGARPVQGHTGLFHFALLVPDRGDLAAWLHHAARTHVPLTGMSDHNVSEALYLRDPDGHGIEIYRDRPRQEWHRDAEGVHMVSDPLDTRSLLAALGPNEPPPFAGLPRGTRMGHVHLHVASLEPTEAFYRDVLGFDLTARLPGAASFFSAGGYHHHLAGNVWAGRGATPPPPGSAALRHATIVVPDAAERDRAAERVGAAGGEPAALDGGVLVRDPSHNGLLLVARA